MHYKRKPFIPIKLPPDKINWRSLIPVLGRAHEMIGKYDGILQNLVNPEILLSPLITKEAVISSKIEGTQASVEDVLEVEAGLKKKASVALQQDIREIINYREALYYAEFVLKSRPITLSLIKEMHKILMKGVRGKSKSPGNFRTTQNWIGNLGSPIEEARFIPPNPLIVPEYMENLIDFLYEKFDDEIVRTAIIHAEFEIIHPFLDGNGRIGRLLIPLIFYSKKLISRPVFYVSEYFETDRKLYYDKLLEITDSGNWQFWIKYFINAVGAQAETNINKALAIINLYNNLKSKFIDITHSQFAIPVLDVFFRKPLVTSSIILRLANINNRVTLNKILTALEKGGVIVTVKKGKGREPSVYAMPGLLNIIK